MAVVDSHCHASPVWYEPVETLLFQMDRYGVDHAVLIQMMGQHNNAYEFECVDRYPGRFSPVVIVDAAQPDAEQTLARLADQGASGVRLRPGDRSPGADPLAIWRAAGRLGLTVSCLGGAADCATDAFAALVEQLPEVRLVIEHLGGVGQPRGTPLPGEVVERVFALARFPNTAMKVTGLGEFSTRAMPVQEPSPFVAPIPDYLDRAYRAFGTARLMWGSDFPPVSSREGYGNALALCRAQFAHLPAAEQEAIFGGTALAYFPPRP